MTYPEPELEKKRWREGLTGYHYLVLVVACLGWLFDTMDQWLYVQAKTPALREVLELRTVDVNSGHTGDKAALAIEETVKTVLSVPVTSENVQQLSAELTRTVSEKLKDTNVEPAWWARWAISTEASVAKGVSKILPLVAEGKPLPPGVKSPQEGTMRAINDAITLDWVGFAQMWFILGWATGGLFFGMVGDRLGRTRTMALTILIYAGFTGLSGLVRTPEEFTITRILTGLGIGGEFAAGAALVAETFPQHARTTALAIVQATSAVGNILAGVIYLTIGSMFGWRWVFAVGVLPAFLLFIIFFFLREPESWQESRRIAKSGGQRMGSLTDLFSDARWAKNALVALVLAAVGVIGFWGIGTWSAELIRSVLNPNHLPELTQDVERKVAMVVMAQNAGGFFGVFAFAFLAQRLGRKPAFVIALIGCAIVVPTAFWVTNSLATALIMFALLGFALLTLFGGYAIYFPELFPTRLRATGTGFGYNVARYLSAMAPFIFGKLSGSYGIQMAATMLSVVFIVGLVIMPFAPETKDKPLPE